MSLTPRKYILPEAAMEKILKKAGAARVSDEAKEKFREFLEEIAEEIGEKAVRLASHAGRKTVKGSDIKEATK
ncbi:NFYB/HAP3 family transcription factor subunit [Candidatus Woesearchaeota archaeon]|nr:NFYB/HAP3 family transcription factor subunit [Candidatus Woesearchaeota archaeon]